MKYIFSSYDGSLNDLCTTQEKSKMVEDNKKRVGLKKEMEGAMPSDLSRACPDWAWTEFLIVWVGVPSCLRVFFNSSM